MLGPINTLICLSCSSSKTKCISSPCLCAFLNPKLPILPGLPKGKGNHGGLATGFSIDSSGGGPTGARHLHAFGLQGGWHIKFGGHPTPKDQPPMLNHSHCSGGVTIPSPQYKGIIGGVEGFVIFNGSLVDDNTH
ncbi:hypothetical protein B6U93_04530 [Candidatus Woesearchaeota archaeon ex4484_78]|nr:MAG: hypothetical protein B6U93_04530 [Candidatus Woesearchaeota archaeon ex4484_78]